MGLTATAVAHLAAGRAVWLRGLPGAGRSHALEQVARAWPHAVLWLSGKTWTRRAVLAPEGEGRPLACVDDAPGDLPSDGWPGAVVAAGERPPPGWTVVSIPPPPTDAAVALFLEHAPGAGPLSAIRALVHTLGRHPLAVVAAARRWPLEALDDLLRDPLADATALQRSFDALPGARAGALRLLCTVAGAVPRQGAAVLGVTDHLSDLVARGWLQVPAPGWVEVPRVVRLALGADPPPPAWIDWLAAEARDRMDRWERDGGDAAWVAQIGEGWLQAPRTPAILAAWGLSGARPAALLDACGDGHPRAAARALRALGQTRDAIARLTPPRSPAALRERGVLWHRLRELDAALADYRASVDGATPRGRVLSLTNTAAVHHDRGELAAAAAGYDAALDAARDLGDPRLEAAVYGNLGALQFEAATPAVARRTLRRAATMAEPIAPRVWAIAQVNLAAVDLLEGCVDAAADRYRSVVDAFHDDPVSAALCRARLAATQALLGQLDTARALHAQAQADVAATDDAVATGVVDLWRGFVELGSGDRPAVVRRIAAARRGTPALVAVSDDARLAVRLLERRLADRADALCIGPEGAWFRHPGGERVDVSRFAAPSRVLAALGEAAQRTPGTPLDGETLFAAGWPGVSIRADAARNRLKVALAKLRKLGLQEVLVHAGDGWLLDPAWPVLLLRE